jgi:hypothetical protein
LTNEELSALPERKDYVDELLPDGTTVRRRIPPRFCAYKPKGDDVIMFHDAEGSWFVDYHLEGGPYKRRAFL